MEFIRIIKITNKSAEKNPETLEIDCSVQVKGQFNQFV